MRDTNEPQLLNRWPPLRAIAFHAGGKFPMAVDHKNLARVVRLFKRLGICAELGGQVPDSSVELLFFNTHLERERAIKLRNKLLQNETI